MKYFLYDLCVHFFSSGISFLIVIIAKMFFNKKFSNKAFGISFLILFLLFIWAYYKISHDVIYRTFSFYDLTLSEKIFRDTSDIISDNCFAFIIFCMALLPVLFVSVFAYFIKTKDKSVLKKLLISILILAPFIYITYPSLGIGYALIYLNKHDTTGKVDKVIENHKYLADKAVLPSLKIVMAREVAHHLTYSDFFDKSYYNSEEFKKNADDYVKYINMECRYTGYSEVDLYYFLHFEKFDELLEVLDKIEQRTGKISPLRISVYIARKDYQAALEIADKADFFDNATKYRFYTKIYAGLKQFDKAYEHLEKYKNSLGKNGNFGMYEQTKMYLDYKSGNVEQAKNNFDNMYKYSRNKMLFDEYIQYLERIEY